MLDKIKVKVSSFVANILENDALRFDFIKNEKSNKNALLNKLIPTLLEVRKARRSEIEQILEYEYNKRDSEKIYDAINIVIDKVYFNDEELNQLDEDIWIRPSKDTISVYDEIKRSELQITELDMSSYIRNILNEYSKLPQYKREALVFDKEFEIFADACSSHQIIHFYDKETKERYRAFAFHYYQGYLYEQTNYCIIYDIERKQIKSIELHKIENIYAIKQKYKPSESLVEALQNYLDSFEFDKVIDVEDEKNVF